MPRVIGDLVQPRILAKAGPSSTLGTGTGNGPSRSLSRFWARWRCWTRLQLTGAAGKRTAAGSRPRISAWITLRWCAPPRITHRLSWLACRDRNFTGKGRF